MPKCYLVRIDLTQVVQDLNGRFCEPGGTIITSIPTAVRKQHMDDGVKAELRSLDINADAIEVENQSNIKLQNRCFRMAITQDGEPFFVKLSNDNQTIDTIISTGGILTACNIPVINRVSPAPATSLANNPHTLLSHKSTTSTSDSNDNETSQRCSIQ